MVVGTPIGDRGAEPIAIGSARSCDDVVPGTQRSGNESVVFRLYEDSKLQKKEKRIRSSAPSLI